MASRALVGRLLYLRAFFRGSPTPRDNLRRLQIRDSTD